MHNGLLQKNCRSADSGSLVNNTVSVPALHDSDVPLMVIEQNKLLKPAIHLVQWMQSNFFEEF